MALTEEIKRRMRLMKICFIDDDIDALKEYISFLKDEGYTNIIERPRVLTFEKIEQEKINLLFLDIGGVATHIDENKQGLSLLAYMKKWQPLCQIVVFSGVSLGVEHHELLEKADKVIAKGSITLADFLDIVEERLYVLADPVFLAKNIADYVNNYDLSELGWWKLRQVRKQLSHIQGFKQYDDESDVIKTLNKIGNIVKDYSGLLSIIQTGITIIKAAW